MMPKACTGGSSLRSRVLVTGATGLLGRQVCQVFDSRGWELRGLAFSRASGKLVKCNLTEPKEVAQQFDEFRPHIVIHCAAERRPDKLEADKDYARRINEGVARDIAMNCGRHGAYLIYLSTNYVFDGRHAPYAEDAQPQPLSVYGESKLAGEHAVLALHADAAIVRVPLLYGPIERIGETTVDGLLHCIQANPSASFDNWQERYPTNTEDVAAVLEAMAQAYVRRRGPVDDSSPASDCSPSSLDELRGIFHWQANERHTKYTMAVIIAEIANLDTSKFVQVDTAPPAGSAPRPQFERMLCSRLESLLEINGNPSLYRSHFKEGMKRFLAPFV